MQNWWADDVSTGVRTAMPVLGREAEVQNMMKNADATAAAAGKKK